MRFTEFNLTPAQQAIREHIKRGVPFSECMFRPGSEAFTEFYQIAKQMVAEGKLIVDWQDQELLDTDIGECIMIEGERVPLDVPIAEEVELDGYEIKPHKSGNSWLIISKDGKVRHMASTEKQAKRALARIKGGVKRGIYKEETELDEAVTKFVIKHKKTKQVLSTHDNYNDAKDELNGISDKNNYLLVKQTKKDAALANRNTMREEVELKEDFYWENDWDSEQFRNFSSLVKYNEGIFKSNKQAKFLLNKLKNRLRSDADSLKNFFGIDANSNEKAILITGYAQWSRYGAKGTRPVTWAFVLDDYGVTKKYKIKYQGDMRKGTSPDPSKTQLEWSRNESAAKPLIQKLKDEEKEQAKAVAATPQGKHIGNIGDRTNFEGTVEMSFGPKYGAFGEYYINKIRTSLGDAILNFGNAMGNKGDKIKFKATVAKHDTDSRSGEPITLVKRVKMSASESKQGVAEGSDYEREPLYHATLKAFEPSIMKSGLLPGGNLRMFDWSDSKYVYLSNYPDIARDFVDPGVIEPDQAHEEQIFKLMKQGGVILKIDQNKLNRQLLSADPHFNTDADDGAETYIYSGTIPPSAIIGKEYFNINESKQGVAEDELEEAEYQGKQVKLNSPKRGGPKKFYVYVKNPKTGNVKKVTWGDTTGLKIKSGDPDRVRSFVARHKCKQANDKTKASYWACRTPRYKNLGVQGGQWW